MKDRNFGEPVAEVESTQRVTTVSADGGDASTGATERQAIVAAIFRYNGAPSLTPVSMVGVAVEPLNGRIILEVASSGEVER